MNGLCQKTVSVPIDGILVDTPPGEIAMFVVTSIPSTLSDQHLGQTVYIHNGKVYDFVLDRAIKGLKAEDLRFIKYIPR